MQKIKTKAFTVIELLVVVSIIAVIPLTVVLGFIAYHFISKFW